MWRRQTSVFHIATSVTKTTFFPITRCKKLWRHIYGSVIEINHAKQAYRFSQSIDKLNIVFHTFSGVYVTLSSLAKIRNISFAFYLGYLKPGKTHNFVLFADHQEKKISELKTMSVQTGTELLDLFLENRGIRTTWEELNAGELLSKSRRQGTNGSRPRIREESVSGDDDSGQLKNITIRLGGSTPSLTSECSDYFLWTFTDN